MFSCDESWSFCWFCEHLPTAAHTATMVIPPPINSSTRPRVIMSFKTKDKPMKAMVPDTTIVLQMAHQSLLSTSAGVSMTRHVLATVHGAAPHLTVNTCD